MCQRFAPLFLIVCLPASAKAHGLVVYVSTPITPPREFLWWLPFSIGILLFGSYLVIRRVAGMDPKSSLARALAGVLAFGVVFYLLGSTFAQMNTAPPPGLGLPHPVFWGLGWREEGLTFAVANLVGLVLFSASLLVSTKWKKAGSPDPRCAMFSVAIYAIALSPFVISGALTHGREGSYVKGACRITIQTLTRAAALYAQDHEGKFPKADGISTLIPQLRPYLAETSGPPLSAPVLCAWGEALERHPQEYIWHPSHEEEPSLETSGGKPLISCPYHTDLQIALPSSSHQESTGDGRKVAVSSRAGTTPQ